ncbi:hypothetical protein AB0I72_22855 [Nocardiopsis sp. NPDC049922]|uniref:hypothetical protein n=1 Tax=Nocardiopsis sp. NPDC049922 TaxID=3155157 RepID=UPI0033DDECA5
MMDFAVEDFLDTIRSALVVPGGTTPEAGAVRMVITQANAVAVAIAIEAALESGDVEAATDMLCSAMIPGPRREAP